ncbi:MAG: ABC transporter ATP-binding protein [Pseudohongiellaceae bacterium]
MQKNLLSVTGLEKSYGKFITLRQLDLQVQDGTIHGLVGLNGSGKTTTLECILGLQSFQAGHIEVLGFAPHRLAEARGRVVAIFDTPSLPLNLTVRQCLQHARLLCPTPARTTAEAEALLGLTRFSDFKIRQLSLGNKRRAGIAQALLGNPQLILLDEPFNGLDAGGVDDVLELIARLNREAGTGFLLSSHQLPYLERVCSHLAILHEGRVVRHDRIDKLLQHERTRVLLRTPQVDEARVAIERCDGAAYLHTAPDNSLILELDGLDSAELNARLVTQGIGVAELSLQRATLDSLFREITETTGEAL